MDRPGGRSYNSRAGARIAKHTPQLMLKVFELGWTGREACPTLLIVRTLLIALFLTVAAEAQEPVTMTASDGATICGEIYGKGNLGVVLAHGGRFNKESWRPQAKELAAKRFRVLAIDFRGTGCSKGPGQEDFFSAPFYKDVLAAVRYLKSKGAKKVSVVGGSYGGASAGDASIQGEPGEIDRVVFLAAGPNLPAEKMKSGSLFVVARTGRTWRRRPHHERLGFRWRWQIERRLSVLAALRAFGTIGSGWFRTLGWRR